jgi:hypothetical protein
MKSLNKVTLIADYQHGASLTDLSAKYSVSVSTARYHVLKANVLCSRTDGIRLAAKSGKIANSLRGRKRELTEDHRKAIAAARVKWCQEHALGVSIKPSGYLEITRGENKGRSVHVVKMEQRLGRRLLPDEVVHHIDGDRLNNEDSNLELLTRSIHARLHRLQEIMSGKYRERDDYGRFN